jgi:hypothetical protein
MTQTQIDMLAAESDKKNPETYFQGDFKILPSPLRRAAYSDRTAFVMASMAHLAYYNFEDENEEKQKEKELKFDQLLNTGGFNLIKTFNSKVTNTQAFLVQNNDYAVLSFRGTQERKDIATDAKALKLKVVEGGIHSGFVGAYTSIMKEIKSEIKKLPRSLPIYITGHSLGAALATVAVQYLENDVIEEIKAPLREQIAACYAFGSPRVGDDLFGKRLKAPVYRVVNTRDIVNVIPLLVMGYKHVGDIRFLDIKEGEIQTGIPFLRRTLFFLGAILRLFGPLFGDHGIVKYRAKLALIAKGRNDELFKDARSGGR